MSLRRLLSACSGTVLSLCLLLGCTRSSPSADKAELQGTINVLVALDQQTTFSEGILEEQASLTQQLAKNFRAVYPGVNIQIELINDQNLAKQLQQRYHDGLSPDLILVNGRSAQDLHEMGLSLPVPNSWYANTDIKPSLVQRFSLSKQQSMGIPVFLVPQVACYNRKRLRASPASLTELMEASKKGLEVGLALDMYDLFWTVEAWGGKAAVDAAPGNEALTPAQKQGLLRWLKSLLQANLVLSVNFFNEQEQMIQGLINGRLDWITCRSTNLERLRNHLGQQLGVAALPNGPEGAASPRTISKVWVFGKDSSPNQRDIAKKFAAFSVNYVTQRFIALSSKEMLPVHQNVSIPTGDSPELQAMVRSEQQAQRDNPIRRLKPSDTRLKRLSQMITQMIYGERSPEQTSVDVINLIQNKSWNNPGT